MSTGRPPRIAYPGLGAALRLRRILQGWSQEEMEYQLREQGTRISRLIISRYETEVQTPGIIPLQRIARCFNCTIDSILEHADRLAAEYAKEAACQPT